MPTVGPGKRLVIYVGESDSWRGHSLYMSILETLRKGGIAGGTVMRALAGYGAHSRIRTDTLEVLSIDLPIVITVVDTPDNIDKALALVGPMVREGLITLEDVEIVKYSHRYLQPLPAEKPVAEIMTRQVTTVMPDTPAVQVAELLLGRQLFKAVPVVDDHQRVVGIITSGDLLRKAGMPARLAIGERLEAEDLQRFLARISHEKTAKDIMTSPVVTARDDEALGHVTHRLLERGLKRLPVVNAGGRLVGMLSRLDLLRAAVGNGKAEQEQAPIARPGQTVGEVMSPNVPIVHVNDDLVDVLKPILRADIKRVVVLDEQDRAVGIITDGDLVARVGPAARPNVLRALAERVLGTGALRGNATARELMSEKVLSAPAETTVTEAIALLLREGRKRLIVVDERGHPIGIVDRQSLLAASLGSIRGEQQASGN
jgi:CBS domain-containing protein